MSSKPRTRKTASMLLRLTLWHVAVLAIFTTGLSFVIYTLLSRSFYERSDGVLTSIADATIAMLHHSLSESGLDELAARDAVRVLSFPGYTLSIYDSYGNLLAEKPFGTSSSMVLPNGNGLRDGQMHLYTLAVVGKPGELRRAVIVYSTIQPVGRTYIVVVSRSLDSILAQLEKSRLMLLGGVPVCLLLAGLAGWFLVKKSLAPVRAMSERALRIGAEDLNQRFEISASHDELSQLARTFNDLLSRLGDSFEVQRRFMTDASHELRTPLSIICSTASITLGLQKPGDVEDYRESLVIIQEEGRRLSRVVEDMFYLARADSGGLAIHAAPFDLGDVLLETVRSCGRLAAAEGVHLQIDQVDEAPALGDEDLIRRIMTNLVANAIHHTDQGGFIFLELQARDGEYRVSVRDTGHGIEQEHRAHIFERFYRANPARSQMRSHRDVTGGAGLGLAISRTLAEAHGGRVWLEESSPVGSTFVCALPIRR